MEIFYIYGLCDPITKQLRYIGKAKNPHQRYIQHLCNARRKLKRTYRDNWIRSILSKELKPTLEILEACDEYTWEESERFWINEAIRVGIRLTNIAQGGLSGPSGKKHPFYGGGDKITSEHRKNMSISARNKPTIKNETRAKMRESYLARTPPNKGRKWSENYKIKMSEVSRGKSKSNDHNKKNSLAVAMMWSKRKGNYQQIANLQKEYFNLFGQYNSKYVEYV